MYSDDKLFINDQFIPEEDKPAPLGEEEYNTIESNMKKLQEEYRNRFTADQWSILKRRFTRAGGRKPIEDLSKELNISCAKIMWLEAKAYRLIRHGNRSEKVNERDK